MIQSDTISIKDIQLHDVHKIRSHRFQNTVLRLNNLKLKDKSLTFLPLLHPRQEKLRLLLLNVTIN